jgi:hypothetical protein
MRAYWRRLRAILLLALAPALVAQSPRVPRGIYAVVDTESLINQPSAISQSTSSLINNYFAGYTFTTPPVNDPFGDLGRNAFRAPGLEQWDLSANKSFRIGEKAKLQFRSEFFNVINHTNFGIPNTTTTSSSFGQIRSTYPARQIQFALKVIF